MPKRNDKLTPAERYARDVKWAKMKIGAFCIGGLLLFTILVCAFAAALADGIRKEQPAKTAQIQVNGAGVVGYTEFYGIEEDPAEGVGRIANTTETHGNPTAGVVTHGDSLDYNINTTLWGWDGHGMEVWEMDLFARIAYLEFWGTSRECCEAGIDSMLLLWDMGEYGRTMGELLSAQYAPGYYVYSPYAYVWDWQYDAQGLADIRAMCEERFKNGPIWCAPYFRLWYYHDWATPAYEIDGVYFSVPRWQ